MASAGNVSQFRKFSAFSKLFRDIIGLADGCASGPALPEKAIRWKYLQEIAKRRNDPAPENTKNFENWWGGKNAPREPRLEALIEILSEKGVSPQRLSALRAAANHQPERRAKRRSKPQISQLGGQSFSPGLGTRPVSHIRHRRLANFWIDTGGQGDTPDDLRVYVDFLGGREPVVDGPGWIAAKMVELDFTATDYTGTEYLDKPNIKAAAGVWRITPKPDETCIEGPLFEDRWDKPALTRLVRNPEVTNPKPPKINAYVPGTEFLHAECTGEAASAPEACKAVIAAFLKKCVTDRTLGIDLGTATFEWETK